MSDAQKTAIYNLSISPDIKMMYSKCSKIMYTFLFGHRGYKAFIVLNSAKHEISTAHKI